MQIYNRVELWLLKFQAFIEDSSTFYVKLSSGMKVTKKQTYSQNSLLINILVTQVS